ncbi:hypothetical protein CUS_7119 [Ruminococcus albus 8]|uniref:Uncharacterized protein n=1 Tax=Ruminococcus albus 8 TaxID=246199 RepID=E9SDV3_RUMAL|nr:hypothetical protein CUS_7119 [Ruminococcus albus 8]
MEGLSCHFLYCIYMITLLCEPNMNFRADLLDFLKKISND